MSMREENGSERRDRSDIRGFGSAKRLAASAALHKQAREAKVLELRAQADAARAQAERERAERERAEQERAEQERAEQERAEQERAEQERAERERAERERAERERAAPAPARTAPPGRAKPRRKRRLLLWAALALLLLGAAAFCGGTMWVNAQPIDKLERKLPVPAVLYDRGGEAVSKLASAQVEPVVLGAVAPVMRNAIVAVEDRRFYQHGGVDYNALGRALFRNAKSGEVVEGGSTITQQLAKNVFLTADRTYTRKLREAALAIQIERKYSKDQILEMYLNQIYFGEGGWGVQRASRVYFGKTADKLTLAEAALLAGLPKAPSNYSPVKHPEAALERRNLVLSLMKEQGMITDAAYKTAKAEPIKLNQGQADALKGNYPSYADAVVAEAEARYGLSEKELLAGGYKIYTAIDTKVQTALERVFADDAMFPPSPDGTPVQSGAAVTDPATGEVRGLVGGRGDTDKRGMNRATDIRRQPGSAIKPLAVYGPALENGYTPESVLPDEPLDIAGYKPKNAGGAYHGDVTLRTALIHSYNVPAVWLLNEIGVGTGADYAEKAGIALTAEDRNLSLALGGLSGGVSPLQMAQAYGAIANGGVMMEAHTIVKIIGPDGSTVAAQAEPKAVQVFRKETTFTLTRLLEDVVAEGTGEKAAMDRPVAGKTGTTQLPDTAEFAGLNGSRDVWFAGYTPELAAAVWMGYDRSDAKHYMTASGGTYPAALFQRIMKASLDGVAVKDFDIPAAYDTKPVITPPVMSNPDLPAIPGWRDQGDTGTRNGDKDDDGDDGGQAGGRDRDDIAKQNEEWLKRQQEAFEKFKESRKQEREAGGGRGRFKGRE